MNTGDDLLHIYHMFCSVFKTQRAANMLLKDLCVNAIIEENSMAGQTGRATQGIVIIEEMCAINLALQGILVH